MKFGMYNISARIDELNRQLVTITKLQSMSEKYNVSPYAICKKDNLYNFGKLCHCARRMLSLKELCSRLNCCEECMLYDNNNRRLPCNSATCNARRKSYPPRNSYSSEAPQKLVRKNDSNIQRNTAGDLISQEVPEKQSKSDQVNASTEFYNANTQDKIINTFEEKSEQTIPTKDNDYTQLSMTTMLDEEDAFSKEGVPNESDNKVSNKVEELLDATNNVCAKDKKIVERIEKELFNEKQRNKDLEEKLKAMTCSIDCLKEESEQKAACLKDALVTAEEQTKVAMGLVEQTKNQTELAKTEKQGLLNEMTKLQQKVVEAERKSVTLLQERNKLKDKLHFLSEDESKRCEEVEKQVGRMKHALKEKENALSKERAEFMNMILELTNVINIQKKRICEVSNICNDQQHAIQEKESELSKKSSELSEVKCTLQTNACALKEMGEKIQELEYCLCQETKICDCLKQELNTLKENHLCEQRIKEKIIEEQNKTISKQRKLLHDSEEMVQQVASEFNELKDELHKEKQKCKTLQTTLHQTDSKLNEAYLSECKQCRILRADIDYLKSERQRALAIAKLASQKLQQTVKQYQNKLVGEKQQHRYLTLVIQKKEQEITCLQSQICHASKMMT